MRLTSEQHPNGMLVIHKTRGVVSKDVSRVLQRQFGFSMLGHVGTLDPEAEGVLPILLGKATRLQDYLLADQKRYEFDLTLGRATDSLDAAGQTVEERDVPEQPARQAIEEVAKGLEGHCELKLPVYSAVKYQGKPLYEYARANKLDQVPDEILKRPTHILGLTLTACEWPTMTFVVDCGKGSYVRAIAVEIAERLGSIGYVSRLERQATGGISLQQAVKLEDMVSGKETWENHLVKMEDFPLTLPKLRLDVEDLQRIEMGQIVPWGFDRLKEVLSAEFLELNAGGIDKTLLFLKESGEFFAIGTLIFDLANQAMVGLRARRLLQ